MRLGNANGVIAAAACITSLGCAAPVRGEVVLLVDTDVAVPRLVDTLRIEVHAADQAEPLEIRELLLADPTLWPVSFGVAARDVSSAPRFRLRLTAFRSQMLIDPVLGHDEAALAPAACPDGTDSGVVPGQGRALPGERPLPQYAIERLVEVTVTPGRVVGRRVLLSGDCLAAPIIDAESTCAEGELRPSDETLPDASPDDPPPSVVGSWASLEQVACSGPAPRGAEGAVCVPGGFGYLGDPFAPLSDCPGCDDSPAVPARVEPFWMDRHEVTVGRLHDAASLPSEARFVIPDFSLRAPVNDPKAPRDNCTWRGDVALTDEQRRQPLVCMSWELAEAFCAWAGGSLPSEAQWYHAATGAGAELRYPWGQEAPAAGETAFALAVDGGAVPPIPPVDAHPRDESPHGVVGLYGSVREILADRPGSLSRPGCRPAALRGLGRRAYVGPVAGDEPCTCAGLVHAPEYESASVRQATRVVRGGSWADPAGHLSRALLHRVDIDGGAETSAWVGFRCVYPDAPGGAR